uniref:Addiction module component CHP02574 family protein n=2 Tax=Flavobacterium columnare TaxID=996 RepID=A0AA94F6E6_9FLAO
MIMHYISDNQGNKTAVVIPISDWNKLTKKYIELESDVVANDIPQWHKDILDKRLQDYLKKPDDVMDFDAFCDALEKEL